MTVVEQRSYSRNWGSTSCEAETCTPGSSARRRSAIAASWAGWRYENSRQTAIDSAPVAPRLGGDPLELALVERLDHAVGADPLRGLDPGLVVDQRGRLGRAEAIELRAVLAGDVEQVGEPAGRDQRRAGAALLEQRVGADGHPVGEASYPVRARPGPLQGRVDRLQHPHRLVLGRRRRLRGVQRAPVEHHRVGERSADVDSQEHAADASTRDRKYRRKVEAPAVPTAEASSPCRPPPGRPTPTRWAS